MAKLKTYCVWAKIDVETNVEINAASLEDAVQRAKDLNLEDFVTLEGDWCSGDGATVTGIFVRE